MTESVKIKQKDIPRIRRMLIANQHGVCPICEKDLTMVKSINVVVDHDHDTGAVRAAMHRGCNRAEGIVLNALTRWGKAKSKVSVIHTLERLLSFWKYHAINRTGLIYYSHKTTTEKRVATNKKRRLAAAKKRRLL